MKKIGISALITLLIGALLFYIMLPPINLQSPYFYVFLVCILVVFSLVYGFMVYREPRLIQDEINKSKKLLIGLALVFVLVLVITLFYSPIVQSNTYANRITIDEDGVFEQEVSVVDFNTLPLLDKDSCSKLGDRVMGQMAEYVSQFSVSDLYTQINYQETVIRVTPLEYNDFFKYWANKDEGVQGYITVNSVSGAAELVKCEEGMKYMTSAYFNDNLARKLRFSYPTAIFGDYSFEIDDDGNPYWIVPVLKYKGIGMLEDVKGVVLLDPITGDHVYYDVEDVPNWVDHVYPADLILEQTNDWGQYKGGFINSIIGQKNVVATTEGYNYLASDGDIYLYTGITSAANDESNLGFILANLRTKETTFYSVPGAEEYSAMDSAEGQVQNMGYDASFPLLINLDNQPTYLISLKDDAGLVKMYAFVDVQDYQKVVVTDASEGIVTAAENYLGTSLTSDEISEDDLMKTTITITYLNQVNIDGTTYFYIMDESNQKYYASIETNTSVLPFIAIGDQLDIGYYSEDDLIEILWIQQHESI